MEMGLDRMRPTLNELWRVQTRKSCPDALGFVAELTLITYNCMSCNLRYVGPRLSEVCTVMLSHRELLTFTISSSS